MMPFGLLRELLANGTTLIQGNRSFHLSDGWTAVGGLSIGMQRLSCGTWRTRLTVVVLVFIYMLAQRRAALLTKLYVLVWRCRCVRRPCARSRVAAPYPAIVYFGLH